MERSYDAVNIQGNFSRRLFWNENDNKLSSQNIENLLLGFFSSWWAWTSVVPT